MNEGKYRWLVIVILLMVLLIPQAIKFLESEFYLAENNVATEINSEHELDDATFVVNMKTKKYHLSSCKYADVKDPNDLSSFRDEDFLMKHGYQPCEKCIFWR